MRILICGDRNWARKYDSTRNGPMPSKESLNEYQMMEDDFKFLVMRYGAKGFSVIHGAAPGADSLAETFCRIYRVESRPFPAAWHCLDEDCLSIDAQGNRVHRDVHGRAAGAIRNRKMVDEGLPDVILAYHSNIEASKGTKDMLSIAKKRKIPSVLRPEQNRAKVRQTIDMVQSELEV